MKSLSHGHNMNTNELAAGQKRRDGGRSENLWGRLVMLVIICPSGWDRVNWSSKIWGGVCAPIAPPPSSAIPEEKDDSVLLKYFLDTRNTYLPTLIHPTIIPTSLLFRKRINLFLSWTAINFSYEIEKAFQSCSSHELRPRDLFLFCQPPVSCKNIWNIPKWVFHF